MDPSIPQESSPQAMDFNRPTQQRITHSDTLTNSNAHSEADQEDQEKIGRLPKTLRVLNLDSYS